MTRTEREALEAVLEEHGQTRRPVSPGMIAIACNVRAVPEREALFRALSRLEAKGLMVECGKGWVPTPEGRAMIEQPAPELPKATPQADPMESGFKKRRALRDNAASQVDEGATQVDETAEQASANRQAAFQEWKRENTPAPPAIPAELLDRCAAMHLTLLEQAREEYAKGNERAGRELAWLIETGEQLVAAGGEAA